MRAIRFTQMIQDTFGVSGFIIPLFVTSIIHLILIDIVNTLSLPPIHWNRSNPIFKSSRNDHVIHAQLRDDIDFVCPHYKNSDVINNGVPHDVMEYYLIYQVSKKEYEECNTFHDFPLPLPTLNCSQPLQTPPSRFTILLDPVQSIPNTPDYHPGGTYYFITTSTGSQGGLTNQYQGACSSHHMKLALKVDNYYEYYEEEEEKPDKHDINSMLQFRTNHQTDHQTNQQTNHHTNHDHVMSSENKRINNDQEIYKNILTDLQQDSAQERNYRNKPKNSHHAKHGDSKHTEYGEDMDLYRDDIIVEPAPYISNAKRVTCYAILPVIAFSMLLIWR